MNTLVGHAGYTVTYALGHSDRELERLAVQARLIDPITRRFFRDAGIVPGMRVLDVGSGVGDVAFLAAELVGETGEVVGVDRAPAALVAATRRADALSLRNVSFCEGDPAEMTFKQPFDAVVGRYVLMFQHDPTTMLRKLVAHVRPGASSSSMNLTGTAHGRFRRRPRTTAAVDGSPRRSACRAPTRAWASNCLRRSWRRGYLRHRCD